ncbi:hypothetical protein C2G38_2205284 [Gigaspora rosea]|uniref:Uncharacterized protein n=1 Tax=Gigaspora rosea TaxID=44941 RepID=A0A397UNK2_9GLOM|nr:hypothetical protein C2G38_2205284 [Gigaspora rosea]
MYFVSIKHEPKNIGNFIHFGVETVQYNSVIGASNIKMDITIIYPLDSPRFKYLGHLGSNIKLYSNYFISDLFKFSKSGKIIIETTDIDYLRTSTININASESSYLAMTNTLSIIDIIDDNIDSVSSCDIKQYYTINSNIEAGSSNNTKKYYTTFEDYIEDNNNSDNKKGIDLIYDEDLQNYEEQEELQPRKRKNATKGKQKAT